MTWKWSETLAAAALTLVIVGCGKDSPPVAVAVKGKAQYEGGKPVAEMILTFHPLDETNKNTRPVQLTDKAGNFSLTCVKGRYKITLAAVPKGNFGGGPSGGVVPGPEFGAKTDSIYRDPEKTPWQIEVPETGKDNIVLIVKAP